MAHRYFMQLAYDGTPYLGWQLQPEGATVQGTLNHALELLLRQPIATVGCGRTDTGVHASDFFVHFDVESPLDGDKLKYKLNHLLPPEIAIYRVFEVGSDMHARFSALTRSYQYHCHLSKSPFRTHSLFLPYQPNIDRMNEAAQKLLAVNDFAAFCKAGGNNKTTICKVSEAAWTQVDQDVVFTISADRFLRNMVRAVVGTLLDVGRGKLSLEEFDAIIHHGSRSDAGMSVPAKALFLTQVTYPFS